MRELGSLLDRQAFIKQKLKHPLTLAIILRFRRAGNQQHELAALAIGIGALINALSLLVGLIRRGSYAPAPGWVLFGLQVFSASALLGAFLLWAADGVNWIGLKHQYFQRIGLMALVLCASAAIYFVVLRMSGLKLRQLLRR